MMEPVVDPAEVSATEGLFGWMLEYMRPYRRRVALLAVLLMSEIVLGAMQPWPMAVGSVVKVLVLTVMFWVFQRQSL